MDELTQRELNKQAIKQLEAVVTGLKKGEVRTTSLTCNTIADQATSPINPDPYITELEYKITVVPA